MHLKPNGLGVMVDEGNSVCSCVALTGRFLSLSRRAAVSLIREHGAAYGPTVTRRTSLLVVGLCGLPLRSDGRISRNLSRARLLQRQGGKIEILRENEWLDRWGLDGNDRSICRRYRLDQLPALAGISADRIGNWIRARLIEPVDSVQGIARFEFRQIAALKRLDDLSRAGVTATRLRRSLRQLAAWLPEAVPSLERLRHYDCGQLVMRTDDGALAEPSGQRLFDFAEMAEPAAPIQFDVPIDADRLFEEALELEDAGRFAEAEAVYRRWLLHFGPDAQICFNLGNVLFSLGERESAIERFRQAIEIDPDFIEAWGNLGSVLSEIGNHKEALAATRRALDLNPAHSAATYNLAHSLQESGSSREARTVWQRYLRCDSDSPWANYARHCLKKRI